MGSSNNFSSLSRVTDLGLKKKKKKKAVFSFGISLCFASSEFDDNMLRLISVARDWFYLRVVTVNLLHFLS